MTKPRKKPTRTVQDATPEWLLSLGIRAGQWQNIPKPQLRTIARNKSNPDHVRVWAVGMLHSYGYRRDRAMILRNGAEQPMRPADLARLLGMTRQHVRRALARLERDGLARRLLPDGTPLASIADANRKALRRQGVEVQFLATPRPPRAAPQADTEKHPPAAQQRTPAILRTLEVQVPTGAEFPQEVRDALETLAHQFAAELQALKKRYVAHLTEAGLVNVDQTTNVAIYGYITRSNLATSTEGNRIATRGLTTTEMKRNEKGTKRPVDGPRPPAPAPGDPPSEGEIDQFSPAGRPRPLSAPGQPARQQKDSHTEIAELINALLAAKLGTVLNPEQAAGKRILARISEALGGATLEQFAQRIAARADSIRSYGVLPHLAADCAAAAATSESIPAGATPAEIAWIKKQEEK